MLARRVIPVLLHRGTQLVKGTGFNSWRSVGHLVQSIRVHQSRNVDELFVLDVGNNVSPDIGLLREYASDCFMPLTVGGGVQTLDHIRDLLANGADKVSIGTAAFRDPGLIEQAAKKFGSQAIVVSIDVGIDGHVWIESGRVRTPHKPHLYARQMEDFGAGEILLQSIPRDGTMNGYDHELINRVSSVVSIPVVACGGCSGFDDMAAAYRAGAHAVAAGALFQFTDATPHEAAEALAEEGFTMRRIM